MGNSKILKQIFDLAKQNIYSDVDNLPTDISKDVVEKNILYIELRNLLRSNGSQERIDEIKAILYSPDEEEEQNGTN